MADIGQTDQTHTGKAGHATRPRPIADKIFVEQLSYVREVVDFLIRHQIDLSNQIEGLDRLAALGTVRYSRSGEPAAPEDWQRLYQVSNILCSQLTNQNATRFAAWQTRRFYSWLPLAFSVGAVIALGISCLNPNIMIMHAKSSPEIQALASGRAIETPLSFLDHLEQLCSVLLWTCSLGGLGVSAFFGTSLLSQMSADDGNNAPKWQDQITDRNYLRTRLSLGILFAFVIGLPFGFRSLFTAWSSLIQPMPFDSNLFTLMLQIIAPFLLGFSTSLVLAILERMIDGVKTMLGAQVNRS